jgi:hypothetical protein
VSPGEWIIMLTMLAFAHKVAPLLRKLKRAEDCFLRGYLRIDGHRRQITLWLRSFASPKLSRFARDFVSMMCRGLQVPMYHALTVGLVERRRQSGL